MGRKRKAQQGAGAPPPTDLPPPITPTAGSVSFDEADEPSKDARVRGPKTALTPSVAGAATRQEESRVSSDDDGGASSDSEQDDDGDDDGDEDDEAMEFVNAEFDSVAAHSDDFHGIKTLLHQVCVCIPL